MSSERSGPIAGVVLAAGNSTRMGRNKLLLELDGEPVIRRAVGRAIDAGLSPVIVVLGFEADRVREVLSGLTHREVVNTEFEAGINSSVQLVLCSQSLFRFADLGDDGLCRGGPDKGCGVIVSAIDVVVDRLD